MTWHFGGASIDRGMEKKEGMSSIIERIGREPEENEAEVRIWKVHDVERRAVGQ